MDLLTTAAHHLDTLTTLTQVELLINPMVEVSKHKLSSSKDWVADETTVGFSKTDFALVAWWISSPMTI